MPFLEISNVDINSSQFPIPGSGWGAAVFSSDVIDKGQNSKGVQITVNIEALDPDGDDVIVGYNLRAVLEAEDAPGIFSTIAQQQNTIKGRGNRFVQVMQYAPSVIALTGETELLGQDNSTEVQRFRGTLPDRYRVCLQISRTDETKPDLASCTVTATFRETEE